MLENRKYPLLDEVDPIHLEVNLKNLLIFPITRLRLLLLPEVQLLRPVGLHRRHRQKIVQLLTAPTVLGVVRQTAVQDLQPKVTIFVPLLPPQLRLQTYQPVLHVHLSLISSQTQPRTPNQLIPPTEHLVQRATERVNVHLGVVDPLLAQLRSLVVVRPADAV